MSVELFEGLVSPEVAGVLSEAMRAMPDSAVSMAPSEPGSDVVNVAIGGGAYDLLLTIDGADCVSELKLVPVHGMGCAGNAVDVLRAGLGVLAAADRAEARDVWVLDEGCEALWDKSSGCLAIECEHTCGQPDPIRGIEAIKQGPGDDRWVVVVRTTGEPYWFRFDTRQRADGFAGWLGKQIEAWREAEAQIVWTIDDAGTTVRWDKEGSALVIQSDRTSHRIKPLRCDRELVYDGPIQWWRLTIETADSHHYYEFRSRHFATDFCRWVNDRIREGLEG